MPHSSIRPRAWHLLAGWGAYWVGLVLVTLGEPLGLLWRFSRQSGRHGSVSAGYENGVLQATVIDGARTAWSGATDPTTLALWLAGPPLLLWVLWLVLRARAGAADAADAADAATAADVRPAPPRGLGAGAPDWRSPAPAERDAARPRPRDDR